MKIALSSFSLLFCPSSPLFFRRDVNRRREKKKMKNRPLDGPLLLLFLLLLLRLPLLSSCLCTATNRAGYMSESECGFHSFVSTLCAIILPSVALSPPRHPVFFVSSPPVLLLLLVSARWCALAPRLVISLGNVFCA